MRNIFDQYNQPENRLTHALASALSNDVYLQRKFIQWVCKKSISKSREKITILEQQLPGDAELEEQESIRKGLPDIWIHDGGNWSLIIESKISSNISKNQLQRHFNTAVNREFSDITILVIDTEITKKLLPDHVLCITWSTIYQWLCKFSHRSDWALHAKEYFEVAESKYVESGYLKEGTLTVFSGVPFDEDEKYNYLNAKRILNLAMPELRKRKDLIRELKIDPQRQGRGRITGKGFVGVWDYLSLKAASQDGFTKYPHLTLSIEETRVVVITTIPHRIRSEFRKNLINLGEDGFYDLIEDVAKRLHKANKKETGAAPFIAVVQRRYPTQSSPPIIDARIEFDLRTAFDFDKRKKLKVKYQPQWLEATYQALSNKKSNLQVAIGVRYPYQYCKIQKTPELIDYIANSWIACKPLIKVLIE